MATKTNACNKDEATTAPAPAPAPAAPRERQQCVRGGVHGVKPGAQTQRAVQPAPRSHASPCATTPSPQTGRCATEAARAGLRATRAGGVHVAATACCVGARVLQRCSAKGRALPGTRALAPSSVTSSSASRSTPWSFASFPTLLHRSTAAVAVSSASTASLFITVSSRISSFSSLLLSSSLLSSSSLLLSSLLSFPKKTEWSAPGGGEAYM